jgi:hypothetical protein
VRPPADDPFVAKADWHRQQRRLSPKEKVRILLELQAREASVDRVRTALGRPVRHITPWRTKP